MPRPTCRRRTRCVALAPLFCTCLVAHRATAQVAAPTLPIVELRQDFDALRNALEQAHGGLYRFASRAEVNRRFDAYRARLDAPMTALAFAGIVFEFVAEMRDGHAAIGLDSLTTARLASARTLPVLVNLEGDRFIITSNDTPADTMLHPGMEIIRINGRTPSELMATLVPKASHDGFIELARRARVARGLPTYYWLFANQTDQFTIEARDDQGRQRRVTLPGITPSERRASANPVNAQMRAGLARLDRPSGRITLDMANAIPRLNVPAFAGARFAAELDSVFSLIRESKTDRLILDLRENGGGVDSYGALLVGHFMDRAFRYFDHIRMATIAPSFAPWPERTVAQFRAGTVQQSDGSFLVTAAIHPGVGEQNPSSAPYRGRLVVLIDDETFSTAADVAAQLRSSGRAVFVGTETGGGYEGNTSGPTVPLTLPNSKLRFGVRLFDYWNAVAPPAMTGRGTIPDHDAPITVADALRGVDVALERARSLLR